MSHVLLIGAGSVAVEVHIPYLLAKTAVQSITIADIDHQLALAVARRFNVQATNEEIEASRARWVWICTPADSHADLAIRALMSGKDVVVEKPLALSAEQADAVATAAQNANRRIFVCHTTRHRVDIETLTQMAISGQLGDLLRIELSWLAVF